MISVRNMSGEEWKIPLNVVWHVATSLAGFTQNIRKNWK